MSWTTQFCASCPKLRSKTGDEYPGDNLHKIVICLQLHFELQGTAYKFLSDPLFLELRNTRDRKMKGRS